MTNPGLSGGRAMLELVLERLAYAFSTGEIRECVRSLRGGKDDWKRNASTGEIHRTKPYPMGFYPNDRNLYWARGWGMRTHMLPWERWLVRRAADTPSVKP